MPRRQRVQYVTPKLPSTKPIRAQLSSSSNKSLIWGLESVCDNTITPRPQPPPTVTHKVAIKPGTSHQLSGWHFISLPARAASSIELRGTYSLGSRFPPFPCPINWKYDLFSGWMHKYLIIVLPRKPRYSPAQPWNTGAVQWAAYDLGWVYLCSLAPGPSEILRRTNLIRNGRRGARDAPCTWPDAASLSQCLIKDFPHFTERI